MTVYFDGKGEIKHSLNTTDPVEAKRLCQAHALRLSERFERLRHERARAEGKLPPRRVTQVDDSLRLDATPVPW